jgi:hypothetical protein
MDKNLPPKGGRGGRRERPGKPKGSGRARVPERRPRFAGASRPTTRERGGACSHVQAGQPPPVLGPSGLPWMADASRGTWRGAVERVLQPPWRGAGAGPVPQSPHE